MIGLGNNVHTAVLPGSPEELDRLMNMSITGDICARILDAYEQMLRGESHPEEYHEAKSQLKRGLPIMTPHATFRDNKRLAANAIPTGLFMMDYDRVNSPEMFYKERLQGREAELGVCWVSKTPGLGVRIIASIPNNLRQTMTPELAIAQAQMDFSKAINEPDYDTACRDLSRASFLVPTEYVFYRDDDILFAPAAPWPEVLPPCPMPLTPMEKPVDVDEEEEPTFKGIKYSDIVAKWFQLSGGMPQPGERNTKLHRLAFHLRAITDDNPDLLFRIIPDCGLTETERRSLIASAMKPDRYGLTADMRRVLSELNGDVSTDEPYIPPMPKALPRLVALLLSRTPEIYKPAVAHAVFPPLAAHMWKTCFTYLDNIDHECTFMNVLMAGTSAGKSCITQPIDYIMADIRERDAYNMEREARWKQEMMTKGANSDRSHRPDGLIIQEVDPDITNAAFVLRMKEADDHFLYAKMNEIEQFDALRGNGRGGTQFQIMCLAFDPGNRYGQTRVGANSVTEKVCVRFNWNASTTIVKGIKYFSNVLLNGPVNRINFCTIPDRPLGAPLPVYGIYDADFEFQLAGYINNLRTTTGRVNCPEARALAEKMLDYCAEQSILTQSRTYEMLSFRAIIIAWLKGCLLYVANGREWEPEIDEFCFWSLKYDLALKMAFFGAGIEDQMSGVKPTKLKQNNLLLKLPSKFTEKEALTVRVDNGKSERGLKNMLNAWKTRGYITYDKDTNVYTKTF